MSLYEQVKALNKNDERRMLGFTRRSLRRQRRIAKNKYERKQDE